MINDHVDWITWTIEVVICATCRLYGAIPYALGSEKQTFTSTAYNTIRRNDLLTPIYNATECNYASLYRHTLSATSWIRATQIKMYECVRKAPNKPCFAVINPRFHSNPSDPNVSPHQWHTKAEFMEMLNELDAIGRGLRTVGPPGDERTLRLDGCIIWNGSDNPWSEFRSRGWWDAMQDYLNFNDPADV
jgi:hypothetical protein